MREKILSLEDVNKDDISIIEEISKKYNMTIREFGKLLCKSNSTSKMIRYGSEELNELERRAGKLKMNRSEYIMYCIDKALQEKTYMEMDMKKLKIQTYKCNARRNCRINIYFKKADKLKELEGIAKKFSMQTSTLIREISLSVEL